MEDPVIEVPVGSIVAYAAPDLTKLPWNWLNCDGSLVAIETWLNLFKVISTSNGNVSNGSFQLPNAEGRFLRGSAPGPSSAQGLVNYPNTLPALNAGNLKVFQTGNDTANPYQAVITNMPTNDEDNCTKGFDTMVKWYDDTRIFDIESSDVETRPDNVYLFYIIKAASASSTPPSPSPSDNPAENIPVGSVIPYVGTDSTRAGASPDWIKCDGETMPVNDSGKSIQALTDLVGSVWNPPNTEPGTFACPNLKGMFVRGVDPSGKVDTQYDTRKPGPGSRATGPGTWQEWATCTSGATISVRYWTSDTGPFATGSGSSHIEASQETNDVQSWNGGAYETRPINAAVSYWINSQEDIKLQQIPIGGVIGVTELSQPNTQIDKSSWRYCDGDATAGSEALSAKLQNTWGTTDDWQSVILPDLRAQFLRGANTDGSAAYGRDGQWNKRTASDTRTPVIGTGSYQNFSTGAPTDAAVSKDFISWKGNNRNPDSVFKSGENLPQYGQGTYTVNYPDDETAPASLIVNFYVRIA